MPHRAVAICLAAELILGTTAASAADQLSGNDLKRYCGAFVEERQSQDAAFCVVFVQGFLGGANIAERMAIEQTATRGTAEEESFVDRATRTRLSKGQLLRAQVSREGYCVGAETSTVDVVERIAPYIESQFSGSELTASEMIHRALVHHFPCDS